MKKQGKFIKKSVEIWLGLGIMLACCKRDRAFVTAIKYNPLILLNFLNLNYDIISGCSAVW
jgi:hypothetical protein